MCIVKHTAFFTALLLLASSSAQADTMLQYSPVQSAGAKPETQSIYIHNGRIRMETTRDGETNVALFNQATQSFTALNDQKRTYMVMNEASINDSQRRMQDARSQAMAKMRERMQNMPQEKRRQMEAAMAGRMAAPPAREPYRFKNTGESRSVHGIPCRVMQAYKGRQAKKEMCIATIQSLNMSQADYRTLLAMQDFMTKMSSAMMQGPGILPGGESLGGVPVAIMNLDNHRGTELNRVSHDSLPDSSFQIPAGYSLMRMPGSGARR